MRRPIQAASAALATIAATLLGQGFTSQADAVVFPTGCSALVWSPKAQSYCGGGGGQHRVIVKCLWESGYSYGPWRPVGAASVAECFWGAEWASVQIRSA